MTTRKQFIKKVKELGCTFEEDETGDSRCITVDAPKRYVFSIRGCHCWLNHLPIFLIHSNQNVMIT